MISEVVLNTTGGDWPPNPYASAPPERSAGRSRQSLNRNQHRVALWQMRTTSSHAVPVFPRNHILTEVSAPKLPFHESGKGASFGTRVPPCGIYSP